ncbi:MAG: hypothetical protein J6J24_05600 [Clostridia bacterium]|nr:hypothetical protein [Clostridia bacterium]
MLCFGVFPAEVFFPVIGVILGIAIAFFVVLLIAKHFVDKDIIKNGTLLMKVGFEEKFATMCNLKSGALYVTRKDKYTFILTDNIDIVVDDEIANLSPKERRGRPLFLYQYPEFDKKGNKIEYNYESHKICEISNFCGLKPKDIINIKNGWTKHLLTL